MLIQFSHSKEQEEYISHLVEAEKLLQERRKKKWLNKDRAEGSLAEGDTVEDVTTSETDGTEGELVSRDEEGINDSFTSGVSER